MFGLIGLALCAASVTAQITTCARNNCYRDVAASAFSTRSGRADCSSYLRTTVTPTTSTISTTVTSTVTGVTTEYGTATVTEGVAASQTSTIDVTATTTTTVSETSVITNVIPTTVTSVIQGTNTVSVTFTTTVQVTRLAKRQMDGSTSTIPAYASNCRSPSQYMSACSCLGVTRSTVTATAPSTTSTIYTTVTPTTSTVSLTQTTVTTTSTTTTQISFETTTVTTEVVTTTVTGTTQVDVTSVVATELTTTFGASTTVTVSTQTVEQVTTLPTLGNFQLKVTSSTNPRFFGQYLTLAYSESIQGYFLTFSNVNGASSFYLTSQGVLSSTTSNDSMKYPGGSCGSSVITSRATYTMICQVDKNTLELTCPTISQPLFGALTSTGNFIVKKDGCGGPTYVDLRLTVIPV